MNNDSISALDRAIQAAQARKAAKANQQTIAADGTVMPAPKPPTLNDAEKAAQKAAKLAEREQKRAEREAARQAKALEKAANSNNKFANKLNKAAERLPVADEKTIGVIKSVVEQLDRTQLSVLIAYIQHDVRTRATETAINHELRVGDTVEIISGDQRYVGMWGTVEKVQRIRCYIEVPEVSKPVYLFKSDVKVVNVDAPQPAPVDAVNAESDDVENDESVTDETADDVIVNEADIPDFE